MSQIGSFPQVGVKIKHIWNHHPVTDLALKKTAFWWPSFFDGQKFYRILSMNYLNCRPCFFSRFVVPPKLIVSKKLLPGKRLGFFANTFTNSMCPPLTPSFEGHRVDVLRHEPPKILNICSLKVQAPASFHREKLLVLGRVSIFHTHLLGRILLMER